MTRTLRALLGALLICTTLSGSFNVFAQTVPAVTEEATQEATIEQPAATETAVVPTEVPPTEVQPTEIPPTEIPTTAPTEIIATNVPPIEEPDNGEVEKDTIRASVVIAGAIQSVAVSPETLPTAGAKMTMSVTWAVPDTAIGGDTFRLTLDPRLNVGDDDFPLLNGNGDVVALASLRSGVVTFTLTDFANTNVNISGNAFFFSTLKNASSFAGQTVDLTFTSDSGQTFTDAVTVPPKPVPTAGPSPTAAPTQVPNPNSSKSASFARSDQGKVNPDNAINFTINGPNTNPHVVSITDNVAPGANWVIDCATVVATPAGAVINCTPTSLTVNFTGLVDGVRTKVTFKGDITGTQVPGQLRTFPNTASIVSDRLDDVPGPVTENRNATASQSSGGGGGGNGNNPSPTPVPPTQTPIPPTPTPIPPTPTPVLEEVSPVNPTVEQAVCRFGAVTTPRVTLPANSAAITNTRSGAVTPGGTVTVTATLGSGYTWDTTPVPGWTYAGQTATFTVLLDDPECTPVSPALPTVTQAVCDFGIVSRPQVNLPANGGGITYTKSGAEVPGGSVTVTARLADGFVWGDTSLPGWSFTATTATRTVVLDAVACTNVQPTVPTITQGDCIGGVLNFPSYVDQPILRKLATPAAAIRCRVARS